MSRTSQEQQALEALHAMIGTERIIRALYGIPAKDFAEAETDRALESAWVAYQARCERTAAR